MLTAGVGSAAQAAPVAVPACQQAGPCVVVEVLGPEGQRTSLSYVYADQILGPDADITEESYPIKGGTDAIVKPGSSINRVLTLAGVSDISSVTFAEVVWDDDFRRHLLTGQEVRRDGAAGFQGDLMPAFYTTDPSGSAPQRLSYIRPQRSPDDDNGSPGPDLGTRFTDPQGSFLVRVHTGGRLLTVGVSATPTDASNRTYSLTTDQQGGGTTFDWVLPGGTRSADPSPTFIFPAGSAAGTYPVNVGVEAADGSFGWGSAVLRAGAAPTATPSGAPTGAGGTGTAKAGPRKKPTKSSSAESNPTASDSAAPGDPSATPGPGTSTGAGPTGIATLAPPPGPAVSPTVQPTATAEPTAAPETGQTVTGILLAAAEPVSSGEENRTAASPESPAGSALGADPIGVPAAVLVAGGALLLLFGGVVSESGRVRRRLRRWSRMGG